MPFWYEIRSLHFLYDELRFLPIAFLHVSDVSSPHFYCSSISVTCHIWCLSQLSFIKWPLWKVTSHWQNTVFKSQEKLKQYTSALYGWCYLILHIRFCPGQLSLLPEVGDSVENIESFKTLTTNSWRVQVVLLRRPPSKIIFKYIVIQFGTQVKFR